MPNMFVEALTVADGKVHDEAREIAIPPESRIAQIAIEPSQTIYKPGQKATIKLKLTGPDGKPFLGSSVVTVYDKAVEYISGGSNIPDIKSVLLELEASPPTADRVEPRPMVLQPHEARRDRHG